VKVYMKIEMEVEVFSSEIDELVKNADAEKDEINRKEDPEWLAIEKSFAMLDLLNKGNKGFQILNQNVIDKADF